MEWTAVNTAATRAAHDDGNSRAPSIAAFRGEVRQLIERTGNEIGKLHFCNGPHSHERGAYRGSDDRRFRNRRIDDAPLAEFLEHTGGDFESASVDSHIFAEHEHAFVALHFFPDPLLDCFNICG